MTETFVTFEVALTNMRAGQRMRRKGWVEYGWTKWITLTPPCTLHLHPESIINDVPALRDLAEASNSKSLDFAPCFVALHADGSVQLGWQPTAEDLLADWEEVPAGE